MVDLFPKLLQAYKSSDNDRVYQCLGVLAKIVYGKHFSYAPQYREDLISEAVLKGYTLLPHYDPSIAGLKGFLYTGMRNSMTNFLYRQNREVLSPVEVDDVVMGESQQDVHITFSFLEIKQFIGDILFHQYLTQVPFLLERLISLGIQVVGIPRNFMVVDVKTRSDQEIIRRLLCLTIHRIWDSQDSFRV